MKKTTISILFFLFITLGYSQVTYFNYLDYTCEWKSYASGWSGFYGYDSYETVYFDGDATINGEVYYKQYRKVVQTNYNTPQGTYSENFLYGPGYVREDSTGKIWYLSSDNIEYLSYDNQEILSAQLDAPFPSTNAGNGCLVGSIQTVMLGTTPLKQVFGHYTTSNSGIVEGIGNIGNNCSMGHHYNRYLNCFSKQSSTIQFGTYNCNLFPIPQRINLQTTTNDFNTEQVIVYPNPTNGVFYIKTANQLLDYSIYNNLGTELKNGRLESENQKIDLSGFPNGIYYLKLIKDTIEINKKIILE